MVTLVLDQPNLYLGELCSAIKEITNIQVSPSTLCKLLARYGLTGKKIQYVAVQRRLEYRGHFIATISAFSKEMLVWVDETGVTSVIFFENMAIHFVEKELCVRSY